MSSIDTKCRLLNDHFLVSKHARGCNNNAASGFSTPVGEVPCSFSMARALKFSSSKKEELFSSSEVQVYPNFFALGIQMEICSGQCDQMFKKLRNNCGWKAEVNVGTTLFKEASLQNKQGLVALPAPFLAPASPATRLKVENCPMPRLH